MTSIHKIAFAAFAALAVTAAPSSARNTNRDVKVMVVIPETHLTRPRIPDPACETGVMYKVLKAGFKVVDQKRIAEIRYTDQMERVIRGGTNWRAEAKRLGRRFGADILVTGEAFSQLVQQKTQDLDDEGPTNTFKCRARVELKAIRMDTGEILWVGSNHQTGPSDLTEELASKACLEIAGKTLGGAAETEDSLVEALVRTNAPDLKTVEVVIQGTTSSRGDAIGSIVRNLSGVKSVSPGSLEGGAYAFEVEAGPAAARSLATQLETNAKLKRFHLKVIKSTPAKIVAAVK